MAFAFDQSVFVRALLPYVIEKLLHVDSVSDAYVNRPGILARGLFESLKFCFCRPEACSAINLPELRGVCSGFTDGKYYPERTSPGAEAAAITARGHRPCAAHGAFAERISKAIWMNDRTNTAAVQLADPQRKIDNAGF